MAVLLALPEEAQVEEAQVEEAQVEEAQVEEGLPCPVYLLVWTLSPACLWAELEVARRLVEECHGAEEECHGTPIRFGR